jgi:fatty acid desaturase
VAALCLSLGASALGFSVFHDANHGTLFRRAVSNFRAARVCSVLLGPSRFLGAQTSGDASSAAERPWLG